VQKRSDRGRRTPNGSFAVCVGARKSGLLVASMASQNNYSVNYSLQIWLTSTAHAVAVKKELA
jgi:hypothetical protein